MGFASATNLVTICLKDTNLTVIIFLSLIVNLIYIQNVQKWFYKNVISSFKQWKRIWLILWLQEQISMKVG